MLPQGGGPRATVSANVTGKGDAHDQPEYTPYLPQLPPASWSLWLRRLSLPGLRRMVLRKVRAQEPVRSRLPALPPAGDPQARRLHTLRTQGVGAQGPTPAQIHARSLPSTARFARAP